MPRKPRTWLVDVDTRELLSVAEWARKIAAERGCLPGTVYSALMAKFGARKLYGRTLEPPADGQGLVSADQLARQAGRSFRKAGRRG